MGKSQYATRSLPAQAYLVEPLENRTLFAVGTLVGSTVDLNSAVGPDAADPVRDVAYVVDEGNSQIDAIDTDTGTLLATAAVTAPVQGLAVSVDDTVLYASEPTAFQVQVFSLPSLTSQGTLVNGGVAINQIVALANGRFAGVDSNGIQIFNGTTGAVLYTVSDDAGALLRSNTSGTVLYSRDIGPSNIFNGQGMLVAVNRPIHEWDTSGVGAPVAQADIPAPNTTNSADFTVNPGLGTAYVADLDLTGVGVTFLSSGSETTYPGGASDTVAALDGGQQDLYSITTGGVAEQFNSSGVELATLTLPNGHTAASLVETQNGVLVYTFSTGVGIINEQNLNLTGLPHLVFENQPSDSISGFTLSPTIRVDVEDSAGNVLRTDESSVTLSLAGGAGSLGGTSTVMTVNGVATFRGLSVTGAGTYTLQATDGGDTAAASNSFAVTGTSLIFQQQPTNALAGAVISPSITVDIENQSGILQTTDDSAVTLTLAQGTGGLAGTETVHAVNGVATFPNVLIDGTGTFALEANDGNDVPGTSASFTVTASASEDHLVVLQQPGSVIPGAVMTPAVEVEFEDANGNLVSTNENVSLSVDTGPGVLAGTTTVAAVNGIATFSSLQFPTVGAYTLSATSAVAAPATSNQFNVGYHLVFAQSPMSVVAGQNIAATVIVEVEDQNGNLVTSQNPTVSLAVASGPSALNGTTSSTAVDGEVIFRTLTLSKVGSYTLTATDDGASATSNTFTAVAGAPAQLVFVTQPAQTTIGKAATVVAVEDALGNVVTGYKSQVKLTVISGPNKRPRSFTAATVHGVATFKHLTLPTPGTYTLRATDHRFTAAVSNPFTIDPPIPGLKRDLENR
jgi:hypothetical protein